MIIFVLFIITLRLILPFRPEYYFIDCIIHCDAVFFAVLGNNVWVFTKLHYDIIFG